MLKYRTLIRFLVKAGHVKPKFVALKPISPNFHYRMVKELVLKRTKSSEICINVPECWFGSFNRHLFLTIKTLNWTNIKGLFLAGLLKVIFKPWSIDLASHVLILCFWRGGGGAFGYNILIKKTVYGESFFFCREFKKIQNSFDW